MLVGCKSRSAILLAGTTPWHDNDSGRGSMLRDRQEFLLLAMVGRVLAQKFRGSKGNGDNRSFSNVSPVTAQCDEGYSEEVATWTKFTVATKLQE